MAAFTWKGATIELVGTTESAYVAESTPMVIYLNIHAAMEEVRKKREEQAAGNSNKAKGPRLLLGELILGFFWRFFVEKLKISVVSAGKSSKNHLKYWKNQYFQGAGAICKPGTVVLQPCRTARPPFYFIFFRNLSNLFLCLASKNVEKTLFSGFLLIFNPKNN